MRQEFNVYCDESCHLENDGFDIMVLGALWCPKHVREEASNRIRDIKRKYNLKPSFEIKWNKVSRGQLPFYKEIINYYFDDDDLRFRSIIIPEKSNLDYERFDLTHDDFYYRTYFNLLKVIFDPENSYNVYVDIKDTNSQKKVTELKKVLRSSHYDFSKKIVKKLQQVWSHEVELLQITDLLIGAISYHWRGLQTSEAKLELIELIKKRSGYSLDKQTLVKERKMNVFIWRARN